ncbi:hypothetical protein QUA42_25290 [Microcoleus sp. Pol11C2]|uniref:hypothetical protein n=1 Tax=Microcoleus sp. Pol11C2 TaxID=3055389 RepID=UPI002FD2D15E
MIQARYYLRDRERLSIPKTGDVQRYVQQQFAVSPDRARPKIAENLRYLRSYRRKVDYDDAVPGLSGIELIAIEVAEKVRYNLSSL